MTLVLAFLWAFVNDFNTSSAYALSSFSPPGEDKAWKSVLPRLGLSHYIRACTLQPLSRWRTVAGLDCWTSLGYWYLRDSTAAISLNISLISSAIWKVMTWLPATLVTFPVWPGYWHDLGPRQNLPSKCLCLGQMVIPSSWILDKCCISPLLEPTLQYFVKRTIWGNSKHF